MNTVVLLYGRGVIAVAKKKLPSTDDEFVARREHFFRSFQEESDRGCVLIAATVLDECLEMLLRARMRIDDVEAKDVINPLFGVQGPLGSFWSKIRLCYAFGMITRTAYADLEIIREIRNLFAHSYGPADFDDPGVIRLSERLKSADHAVRVMKTPSPSAKPSAQAARRNAHLTPPKKERIRFAISCSWLAASLQHGLDVYRVTNPVLAKLDLPII